MKTRLWLLALFVLAHNSVWAACNPYVRMTAPDQRYNVDSAAGLVTDTITGLIWQRCTLGQSDADCSSGTATPHNWQEALQAAASSTFAAYNDWRLPNRKELASLVERQCYSPAINSNVFPGTENGCYWSSSPNADNNYNAWGVDFLVGYHYRNYKGFTCSVRLVRGG